MTTQELLEKGVHFGYSKSRRHPSMKKFIFTTKNRTDIFDLDMTVAALEEAKAYMSSLAKEGKKVLFVGTKPEAKAFMLAAANELNQPFVTDRWIGGTLTNFKEIRKRADRLTKLRTEKESGDLAKYTKKEQLGFKREIIKLDRYFGGLVDMTSKPDAIFMIDPKKEEIAVNEARVTGVPIIALASSDCNIDNVAYAIPANDSAVTSISYFVEIMKEAYNSGK
jgi:small subunit ribosomal protein S2